MADDAKKRVLIKLTEEQKRGIKELTGKDAEAIECTPEELEMKLAPTLGWRWLVLCLKCPSATHCGVVT
jgi:hypothetical protein